MLVFLEQTGVQISRTSSTLVASRQSGGQTAIHLELEADMDFFHLALAAALLSQKEYRIACDEKSLSYSYGIEFLDFLGAKYSHEARRLLLPPQKIELPAEAWTSPAPEWTLAFALLAFSCPGLRLNNPGQLLAYWPGFWNISQGRAAKNQDQKDIPRLRDHQDDCYQRNMVPCEKHPRRYGFRGTRFGTFPAHA